MSRKIVKEVVLTPSITLKFTAFEWFAHNCEHCHTFGTDIPFSTCNYKERGGDCCYRFCKKYKRNHHLTTLQGGKE